jgi:hypothetical protein
VDSGILPEKIGVILPPCAVRNSPPDPPAPAHTEPALAERYAQRAVEMLARAHAAGHFREEAAGAAVREDEDFADLKKRDGFRKLVGP